MTGWVSRGLIATALGAILAFAVTVRVAHVDIANAGAIIMFAGIGYLLVHLGLLGYERGWLSSSEPERRRDTPEPYDRYERRERYDRSHDDGGYGPPAYDERWSGGRAQADQGSWQRPADDQRGYAAPGQPAPGPARQAPRPAQVEYRRGGQPYAGDPDDTRVMPAVRDTGDEDTTVLRRRPQRPDR